MFGNLQGQTMTDQEAEDLAHDDAIVLWMELQENVQKFPLMHKAGELDKIQILVIETALMHYANSQLTSFAEELDED